MSDGFWTSQDSSPTARSMQALINGAFFDGSDRVVKPIGTTDNLFQLNGAILPDSGAIFNNNSANPVKEFGLLRAAAKATAPTAVGGSNMNTNYVQGPFYELFLKMLAGNETPVWGSAWAERDAFGKLSDLNDKNMTFESAAAVAADVKTFGDVLVDTTSFETFRAGLETNYATWLGLVEDTLEVKSVSMPSTFDWDTFSWTAPTVSTITAGTVATPTATTVADNIDDAVEAFTALVDDRYTQEEANLRASLFGGRALMTTAFDNALAILSASKQAQINDYDKGLRAEEAKMQAQADMAHQQNLVSVNTTNAQLSLDAARANTDNVLRLGGLTVQGAQADAESHVRSKLGQIEAVTRIAAVQTEQYTGTLRVRADVLTALFNSTMAYINTRSGASAASLYSNIQDIKQRELAFQRQFHNQFLKDKMDYRSQISGGLASSYEIGWKSMLQNIMVIKEAMSAIGAAPQGTEHHPSGFEKIANVASLGTGLLSSGINLGMTLG